MRCDIVIPTANLKLLGRCIETLRPSMGDLIEHVIIVMQDAPGFTAQVERGWRGGAQEAIVFLNDDAFLVRSALERLLEELDKPNVGATGPSIPCQSPQGFARPGWCRETIEVPVLVGACLAVRREALEEIGGWDCRYTLFHSDYDLSYRLVDAGWKLIHVVDAWVNHIGRTTAHKLNAEIHDRLVEHDNAVMMQSYPSRAEDVVNPWLRRRMGELVAAHGG